MVVLGLLTDTAGRGKSSGETTFDCLLAASIASWGILGLMAATAPPGPVRWAIAALHLTVASLLLGRSRVRKRSTPGGIVLSLPALAAGGAAFSLAAPPGAWSSLPQLLFLAGFLLTFYALATLGSNFGFFPGLRSLTTGGPYRWLRHPAYSGELLMIAACAFSRPTPIGLLVAAAAFPLVGLRVRVEEAVLRSDAGYRAYAGRVRFRLIPGIW